MKQIFISFLLLSLSQPLFSQLRCADIFGDHMVLQRDQQITIWGWAAPKEKVSISFVDQELSTKADIQGRWEVSLPAQNAGGPFSMEIKGKKEKLTINDIWMGEVWLCSGQSNMEWKMNNVNQAEVEIAAATNHMIRLFNIPDQAAPTPQHHLPEATEGWKICTPENIRYFSAVAYFMARGLQPELGVPIGLISSSWGGTNVETWTSQEAISNDPDFSEFAHVTISEKIQQQTEAVQQKLEAFTNQFSDEPEKEEDHWRWNSTEYHPHDWKSAQLPGIWEDNGAPDFDGIMWYRKDILLTEQQAATHATLSLAMIDDNDLTWINGVEVGSTNGYNIQRSYEVPPGILRAGKNVIAIRVVDNRGGGGIYGEPDALSLSLGKDRIPLAGTWSYRPVKPDHMNLSSMIRPNDAPALLYNGMIHPIVPFRIAGVIWYQGEANAGRAYQYRRLFPLMIEDWRQNWGYDFPFLWVQLANFKAEKEAPTESDWAELREAQSVTLRLPNTGQAVIIDIGDASDIHPRNKQDVGHRLALSALHVAYGQENVFSGPIYRSVIFNDGVATLSFDHIGSGLMAKDRYGYLKGFAVAGEDKIWHWARATIEGEQIKVWSQDVENPVAVRYGWADNPADANLYNKEGLPASPFRTDSWKGITQP